VPDPSTNSPLQRPNYSFKPRPLRGFSFALTLRYRKAFATARPGLTQVLAGMKSLPTAANKAIGFVALLMGLAALAVIVIVVVAGGKDLLSAPGSLALVFLFSLVLLVACSGFTLLFRPVRAAQTSLVPRWALTVSGSCMLLSVVGLAYFGGARSASGIVLLGGLGAYWLWSGLRSAG
jgi:hypothetical protein